MQVVAELQGDLLGARGPLDLTTKMLLIPSIRVVGRHRKPPIFIHVGDFSAITCILNY